MTLLVLDAGPAAVTARVVAPDGSDVARSVQDLATRSPAPGLRELAPEDVWRATLAAVRDVLRRADAPEAVHVTAEHGVLVLWDRETLGSPRPAVAPGDRRTSETGDGPRLAWIAEHEPHTWALVLDGTYAVGPLGSYLLARMTRGTWHVVDAGSAGATGLLDAATGAWSSQECATWGVPPDALPDVVASSGRVGVTDARSFCGLEVPVTGIAGRPVPD